MWAQLPVVVRSDEEKENKGGAQLAEPKRGVTIGLLAFGPKTNKKNCVERCV